MKGFSLIELLVSVAIIGILSAIAVPMYSNYVDTARVKSVQDGLMSIYMQQQSYFSDNNVYYSTGAVCNDYTTTINNTLFGGTVVLDGSVFKYCITQATTTDFTAQAVELSGARTYTITQTKATNF